VNPGEWRPERNNSLLQALSVVHFVSCRTGDSAALVFLEESFCAAWHVLESTLGALALLVLQLAFLEGLEHVEFVDSAP
jgi:hypothetical protein